MNRQEIKHKDAVLQARRLRTEDAAARQIRRLTIEWLKPIVEAIKAGKPIPQLDKKSLAEKIIATTKTCTEECVHRLTDLYASVEADILNELSGDKEK
ncbi:hypothetical protein NO1_0583 [Candidatus Termititenax aidoneus]|uniref:Uncharacterized protein n=1 Tax=Termititenax aidoneus TaxID=2218524 RepID=A0A388T955_TERA1|nr:hypothetical protein NO1_0583 [Candidatus Termititenax aidoneus]